MNKKALLPKEILELILAVVVIAILLILFIRLLSPSYNKDEEAAKSYLDSLTKAISSADTGNIGDFSLWASEAKMVYFGDFARIEQTGGSDVFLREGIEKNSFCFCYEKKVWVCKYCLSLEYPAKIPANIYEPNIKLGRTYSFKITKDNTLKVYNFEVK